MYKLVAIDLDGTLLDSEKHISKENIEAVGEALDNDCKVVICSGRVYNAAAYYAQVVNTPHPVISCNGAVITDQSTGEVIYDKPLEPEVSERIIDICHRQKVYFHAYVNNDMYTEALKYDALQYMKFNERIAKRYNIKIHLVENFGADLRKAQMLVSKFVVISDDRAKLASLRKEVEAVGNIEIASSADNNFEVYRLGVNKGEALRFLSGKLGIDRESIAAIGDNENDYSMINYAGLGIAMGNALECIKRVSRHVTLDNDENGVAYALKRFILQTYG
jgi:Cof subfamily protein (haloacid dehalogenase superfamily)